MTIPSWPSGLPNELLQRGYNQTEPDTVLRSSMDVGPDKIRRRCTATPSDLKGTLLLTETQLGTLRTFYTDTLISGSLRFEARDPVTLVLKEFRFTSPPTWSMNKGYFEVQFSLEILP